MDGPRWPDQGPTWWVGPVLFLIVIITTMITFRAAPDNHKPSTSLPCPLTIANRIAMADVIASGSIFAVLPGGVAGAQVIFSPETIYQGMVEWSTLKVNARNVQTQAGGMPIVPHELQFQSGQPPYLLYLRRTADGSYTTRACDGSRFLGTGLTPEEQKYLPTYAAT